MLLLVLLLDLGLGLLGLGSTQTLASQMSRCTGHAHGLEGRVLLLLLWTSM